MKSLRFVLAVFIALALGLASVSAQQQGQKKEYQFKGKIEKVDTRGKTVSVNGENVEGWMTAMTMNYKVDKADVFEKLKVGDQITAKVYSGDFNTLYDVKVVPPPPKP
jgi:Cu/Ag efflux protein CusF